MKNQILFLIAILATTLSSFFLTIGFWKNISLYLTPIAIGLEVSKVSLFTEMRNYFGLQKLGIITVSLILSATSIFTSKIQIETLVQKQNDFSRNQSIAFKIEETKRKKIIKSIELKEKSIAKDLDANYRTRALETQKELDLMLQSLNSHNTLLDASRLKIDENCCLLLAGILDLVIFSLIFISNQHNPHAQNSPAAPLDKGHCSNKVNNTAIKKRTITKQCVNNVASELKILIKKTGSTKAQELRASLGISTHKVCKGLQELAHDGFLVKRGRSYKVVGI